jgi:hypothetical protein
MSCSHASRVVGTRSREILPSGFETFVYDLCRTGAWALAEILIVLTSYCQAGKATFEPSEGDM